VLQELIDEVMAEVEPLIAGTSLEVSRALAPRVPEIRTDRQKVKQIILNLLSNALKFTHHGGVTIAAKRNAKERTVTLSVTDTGIGIATADQDRIFEDFRQLDNSPTRPYGGTGLGLSICRRLAQMIDGRISVQSQPSKGSMFVLTLPTKGRK
jgi:signal transduction histidine kinase